jgi:SAM-dependent methyltransferase
MSFHLTLGKLFLRTGAFIRSMAVMAMKPDDLIRFSRENHRLSASIEEWGSRKLVDAGLTKPEKVLLDRLPVKKGRLLLLGLGGGREAISLSKSGFQVTGVEYVGELIIAAEKNAKTAGIVIEGLLQDLNDLRLPYSRYDVVWFSRPMYSVVPTRKRRLNMLKRIHDALQPKGCVVCQFHWAPQARPGERNLFMRRLIALLTLGNLTYEPGDALWGNFEFVHAFGTETDLISEFTDAGFEAMFIKPFEGWHHGGAIFRKRRVEPG